MKIVKLFFRYIQVAALFSTLSFAASTVQGTLQSGDEIVLMPLNAHALSITHARGKFASNSNFDFIMMNKNDILYEDKNQVDDVYLVFHDDVEVHDRIKIHVNRGYFNYKIAPLQALPKIVKNVLNPDVFEAQKRVVSKNRQQAAFVAREIKKAPVFTPAIVKPLPVAKPVAVVAPPIIENHVVEAVVEEVPVAIVPPLETSVSYESPIGDNFFEKFTKIFEDLVATLASPSSTTKHVSKVSEKSEVITGEKGIEESFDDTNLRRMANENKKTFTQAPQHGIADTFDDTALKAEAQLAEKKVFPTVEAPKEIVTNKYVPTQVEEKFSGTHTYQPAPKESTIVPTQIASVEAPAQKVIVKEDIQVKIPTQSRVQTPASTNAAPYYPDTGYKDGYEALDKNPKPVVKQEAQVAVNAPVVEDKSLPNNTKPQVTESTEDKRLVITKIIDKPEEEADPYVGRVLGKIDDRVLGNGYNGASITGKLGMRVTKNSKPVSAWIEVFKNGTKQRVKTFYTSKGKHAKTVKLPAGTYMVRATYRSRDSKQQKTINNIQLKEGGNVNRAIAFHDGKLRVVAKRGDKPLYVKVVAYKSGTHTKVSYDFSSRNSGVATLSLGSGTYDIEVLDHENKRAFDGIHISGGATETINADF